MYPISNIALEKFVYDDLSHYDLTTMLQRSDINAKMSIFTRQETIISCIEEVQTIARIFDCKVEYSLYSKAIAQKGDTIITICGTYTNLHKIWRSCQNILEYSCQIATYTNAMLKKNKIC